jgi:hypothetical protein
MKKIYSAPSAVAINLVAEGMMAASNESQIQYSDESVKNESQILSNGKGWDSSSWTDED